MKRISILTSVVSLLLLMGGCQKEDLNINPNAASSSALVSASLLTNRMTNEIYNGGGVMDGYSNNQPEGPWNQMQRWNQYFVSNYNYYWGNNFYTWSNTATHYGLLKYAVLLDQQIKKQGPALINSKAYSALSKFFKAYSFIWYTQRVGDIPMTEAGNINNLTPVFDSQHDVYKNSLALLDTANTLLGSYIADPLTTTKASDVLSSGDIYGLTYMQWQKVINTYRLRVLLSLSKRAVDTQDLNIAQQFATIVGNPAKYPIMTSNSDNMIYKYNKDFNQYPVTASGLKSYSVYANISDTYLNIATANQDPRTFLVSTPAPAQIAGGKKANDFAAYVGSDMNVGQSTLLINATNGMFSYAASRYYTSVDGAANEPYIVMGYPELCFNIAEAANVGWISGGGSTWYTNGVNASLAFYGLKDKQKLVIADRDGKAYKDTVVVDLPTFQTNVAYKGDNASGLKQILEQKYVAMFQNSGWEAFYNWRRTGVPSFAQGGAGIGTGNSMIPRRWLYPNDEIVANSANYQTALQRQYGGADDVSKDIWAIK